MGKLVWNSVPSCQVRGFYLEFIQSEVEISNPTRALEELSTLLEDEEVKNDIKFIAKNCENIVGLLTWFEGRQMIIHEAYNRIMDLLSWALEQSANQALPTKHRKAFDDTAGKLKQYYSTEEGTTTGRQAFRQQGLDFLKAVRLYDSQQAKILSFEGFVEAIPGLLNNSKAQTELQAYKHAV